MAMAHKDPHKAALEWYLDMGVDEALLDAPQDRTAMPAIPKREAPEPATASFGGKSSTVSVMPPERPSFMALAEPPQAAAIDVPGAAAARLEAEKLAKSANTLDELRAVMAEFDGLAIRKTATQMVFSDGNPASPIMLIGEAPGADEDRIGRPFVGVSGQLLDKIFAAIGLSRTEEDPAKAVYISNILNWRPPGNRTPSPAEVDVSLPFIERHIALANPKLIILCGGVAAKALLGRSEGITKLRGTFHTYQPQTEGIGGGGIPAICTYHPSYLLRTPSQKKAVWADMLTLKAKMAELGNH